MIKKAKTPGVTPPAVQPAAKTEKAAASDKKLTRKPPINPFTAEKGRKLARKGSGGSRA